MTETGTPVPPSEAGAPSGPADKVPGARERGGPPEVKPGLNEKLMESLNTNILKLAVRLEQTNLAEFVEVTQKPSRLLWTNFMAGLARGVGLFVGGGIMGAVTLALLTWSIYHLLKVFDMIPIVNQLSKLLTKEVDTFLLQHHITR